MPLGDTGLLTCQTYPGDFQECVDWGRKALQDLEVLDHARGWLQPERLGCYHCAYIWLTLEGWGRWRGWGVGGDCRAPRHTADREGVMRNLSFLCPVRICTESKMPIFSSLPFPVASFSVTHHSKDGAGIARGSTRLHSS